LCWALGVMMEWTNNGGGGGMTLWTASGRPSSGFNARMGTWAYEDSEGTVRWGLTLCAGLLYVPYLLPARAKVTLARVGKRTTGPEEYPNV
jgi:hypothetical protein